MRRRRFLVGLPGAGATAAVGAIGAVGAMAAAPARAQSLNGFDLREALVPAHAIERGGPPRDGIPAIDHPRFVAASGAGLKDNDRVLGLALNGVARAYPVRILNWHEVVDDNCLGRSTTTILAG